MTCLDGMDVTLHRLKEVDPDSFAEVAGLWAETGVGNPARGDSLAVLNQTLRHGAVVLVARHGGEAIGTLWLTHDFRRAYIHHMAVKPELQNRGIGKLLMQEAVSIARELGFQAKLEVHRDNPAAQKIYRDSGFVELDGFLTMIKRDV